MISIKSTKGFHIVRMGKGSWAFDTINEVFRFIAERY